MIARETRATTSTETLKAEWGTRLGTELAASGVYAWRTIRFVSSDHLHPDYRVGREKDTRPKIRNTREREPRE
jgi:hypothetical protein